MQRKNTPSEKTGKNLIGMQTHLAFEGEKNQLKDKLSNQKIHF